MKIIILTIAIFFSYWQYSSCFEGIGVNLGGGLSKFISGHDAGFDNSIGINSLISFSIPLNKSHLFELEFGYIRYWFSDKNDKIKSDGTPFYHIKIYFTDKEHFLRPNINTGACTLPFLSWSLGASLEFNISKSFSLQISGMYFIDFTRLQFLVDLAENSSNSNNVVGFHPDCLVYTMKYYLE